MLNFQILDEVYRVLHYIKVTPKLARPYKVTDELFDLSTMAMEYFKERIEPTLPEIPYFGADFVDLAVTFSCEKLLKYSNIIHKSRNLFHIFKLMSKMKKIVDKSYC